MDENKKNPYDLREIFQRMELELIASLKRNFFRHKAEELKEGFSWEQWQLVKLRNLVKFRKKNKEIIGEYSKPIEAAIEEVLKESVSSGEVNVENVIKKAQEAVGEIKLPQDANISKVIKPIEKPKLEEPKPIKEMTPLKDIIDKVIEDAKENQNIKLPKAPPEESFFGANDKKINALIDTVKNDIKEAQKAVLRKMDDVYRQVIYKAEMNMTAGAKTLEQAIDMATKEFLEKGINCIEYKDGKRVNVASYAEMALRTASQRATFMGEGKKRDEWGIHTVVVSAHATTCEHCAPWQAKVLIDDVFSSGSKADGDYPLLSEAMKSGLLHPNCRHTLATYLPGITKLPVVPDEATARKYYEAEQEQRYIERQIRKWKRLEEGCLEESNKVKATDKVEEWKNKLKEHLGHNKQLRRDYGKEQTRGIPVGFSKYDSIETIVTKDNITISNITQHFKERALVREITPENIIDALESPLKIDKINVDDLGRLSKKYIGVHATVAINPDNGNIITTYRTSTRKAEKLRRDNSANKA